MKKVKRGVWDPQVLDRGQKVPWDPQVPQGHLELLSLAPLVLEVNLVSGQSYSFRHVVIIVLKTSEWLGIMVANAISLGATLANPIN